jgi:hypothetical protein
MATVRKRVDELTPVDFQAYSVWQYTNSDEDSDETMVRPVKSRRVNSLDDRVVGVPVKLADGSVRWAMIGNVDLRNPRLIEHFLTITVFDRRRSFAMARYHDVEAKTHGPRALAKFLRLPLSSVFPISYEISAHCLGARDALVGMIEAWPKNRLTRGQIIALAVQKVRMKI